MEEEERGQMISQNPKAGSSSLFVRGNRDKEFQFLDGGCRERTCGPDAKKRKTPGKLTHERN